MFAANSNFGFQIPLRHAIVVVHGMKNARCASSVASALECISGVDEVNVSLETGEASVYFNPKKVATAQLRTAVRAVGFEAELLEDEALLA
jgi:copper chaperone CopZ